VHGLSRWHVLSRNAAVARQQEGERAQSRVTVLLEGRASGAGKPNGWLVAPT